jgi:ABC-type branched-subunit amino acid transport system substrate-binding protein
MTVTAAGPLRARSMPALRLAAGAVIWLSAICAFGIETMPIDRRGKEIYMYGRSASRKITATLDGGTSRVAAAAMPCASCHGNDGRGRPEGGATPSDITFESLRRAYRVTTASGRVHGPYDDRTLRRAIEQGVDSSGNRLDALMPRYSIASNDLRALLAYMKRLGSELDPGLSETRIRLGVVLPPHETMPEASAETRAVVSAWFEDVNRRGGIFGRQIDLSFVDPAGNAGERAAAVRSFAERGPLFAFVSSFSEGAERELSDVAEEERIPFLSTITSNPRSSVAPVPYVRELFAGLAEQSRALVRMAGPEAGKSRKIAIVARGGSMADARDAAVQECRDSGYELVEAVDPDAVDFAKLRRLGVDTILILEANALPKLLRDLETPGWTPIVLAPASLTDPSILADAPVRSFVSFPTLPIDYTEASIATHERLAREHHAGMTHRATQAAALASAALVTDALTRAGRNLSRDALLATIDTTNGFRSGFAPPLTFRPDRHLGSTGCYIIAFEPGKPPKSVWLDVE